MSDSTGARDTIIVHDLILGVDEAEEALCAIRSGHVDALVVSASDKAQQIYILKGADDAQRVLLETLNEGAMMIAPDMTILYANRRLAELLGSPLKTVLGASVPQFLVPADVATFAALLSAGCEGGKAEISLLAAGGEHVPVMVSMRAVGGDQDTYTVVATDLTLLKEAQLALQRAKDELEARVLARTAEIAHVNAALRTEIEARTRLAEELRRKAEELTEADHRKDEFLSMLAHELRNPLSPILTSAEMLRVAAPSNPTVERYRAVIERQTKNLTRLVDDLLDVSRIRRRAITLHRQEVDLADIVQSAVDAARPLIDACGHRLGVSLPREPVPLFVDPTRFEQVLVNLLNNAAKYSERGALIRIVARRDGDRVVIRVQDSGLGISPELLPRVFDLFVQGERSLDRSQGGLGIGLTLVKSLIEMHGGTVEAQSDGAGQGSELILHVPISNQKPKAQPASHDNGRASAGAEGVTPRAAPAPEVAAHPGLKILVAEDNADAAEVLVELLRFWGFDVRSAADGDSALAIATEFHPQIALIDIGLPGIDGYEVARRLRRSETNGKRTLLIGLSGYAQERDRREGVQAGFDHHLAKPLRATALKKLLDRECKLWPPVQGAA
jgi:PAS domain S-box-containing protein